MIKKSDHPCFNCFTTFGSSVEALCTAWYGVVKAFSSFLGSCCILFECFWTKHAGVVTDLFNTKLSSVECKTNCLYLLPSCSQAAVTNGTVPRRVQWPRAKPYKRALCFICGVLGRRRCGGGSRSQDHFQPWVTSHQPRLGASHMACFMQVNDFQLQ